eukprot:6204098-Pleurochrysis_carterae.AAC.2
MAAVVEALEAQRRASAMPRPQIPHSGLHMAKKHVLGNSISIVQQSEINLQRNPMMPIAGVHSKPLPSRCVQRYVARSGLRHPAAAPDARSAPRRPSRCLRD